MSKVTARLRGIPVIKDINDISKAEDIFVIDVCHVTSNGMLAPTSRVAEESNINAALIQAIDNLREMATNLENMLDIEDKKEDFIVIVEDK